MDSDIIITFRILHANLESESVIELVMTTFHGKQCLVFLIFMSFSSLLFSQNFLPKLDQFKSIQNDTNSYWAEEIWLKSKDINDDDLEGFMKRAATKYELGYLEEALIDLDKAIGIDSSFGRIYSLKGYILLKSDSARSALNNFNKAITLNDTTTYNYFCRAHIYSFLGNFSEAKYNYDIAIKMDSSFIDAYFGLANLYFMKSQPKKAEDLYKKVIELDPSFALAYFNRAIVYLASDLNKATKDLNKCIEINPTFAPAYFVRGYIEKDLDKISATFKDWGKAIELDPENHIYHITRGFLNIVSKNYKTGFSEIATAIVKYNLKDYFTYFEQSAREKITNDFISQVATYNAFSEQLSESEKDIIINSLCMFFLGKFKAAEESYSVLINFTSMPGLAYYLRGFNLEYLHQANLSLECYNKAISQDVFPSEAYLRTGIVLNFLGEFQEAIRHLNNFIENNDSTRLAHRSLASSYISIEKYDSAIYEFDKLIKNDSTELDIYFDRAFCYKKMEKYNEAIRDLKYLLNYKPSHIETICLLAECRYSSGDTTGAYTLLNNAYSNLHTLTNEGYFLRGTINLVYKKYDDAIKDFSQVLVHDQKYVDAFIYRGLCFYCKGELQQAKSDLSSAININNEEITALYTRGIINIKLNSLNEAYEDFTKAEKLGHPLAKRAIQSYLKDYIPPDKKN